MSDSHETIVVSAPGKVILHGEHAVVHGKMALAGSLNLRTSVKLRRSTSTNLSAMFTDIGHLGISWSMENSFIHLFKSCAGDPLKPCPPTAEVLEILSDPKHTPKLSTRDTHDLAIISFLYLYVGILGKFRDPPLLHIEVRSHLPTGAGLGSSAAYSTCLACALLLYSGAIKPKPVSLTSAQSAEWSKEELDLINSWSYQSEVILHEKPSGIDNSTSTFGGALSFQRGKVEQLGSIPQLRILLTNTRVARSTKELVTKVFKRYESYVTVLEPILQSIDAISQHCRNILLDTEFNFQEAYSQLQELVDMNQHLLASLGVSHQSIDQICTITKDYGLSTKLTGAGGGGCTLTLIPPNFSGEKLEYLMEEIRKLGFDCFDTVIGGPGVLQHNSSDWPLTS